MGNSKTFRFTVRCAVDLTDIAEEESSSSVAPHGFESMTNYAEDIISDVDSEFLQEINDWEPTSYGTFHLPFSQGLYEEWDKKGYEYSTHAHISFEKEYNGTFSACWQKFKSDYITALEDFDDEDLFSLTLIDLYDVEKGQNLYPSRIEGRELLNQVIPELQKTLVGKKILSRYNNIEGNSDKIIDNIDLFWGDVLIHFDEIKNPEVKGILKEIPKMKVSKILGLAVPPAFEFRELPDFEENYTTPTTGAKFCDQCGAKKKSESSKFCSSCGEAF